MSCAASRRACASSRVVPCCRRAAPLVDMVGTGGDGSGSFNLSTGAALLVAAMGIRVAKHGTSSVSSRSGSADVIRALGLNLPLDETAAGECLAATGFTFFFAPHYHPAMKAVMPMRQALGVRTVFNILGPLSNPAEPAFNLIGAYHVDIAALMAETLAGMPMERAYVVHGAAGLGRSDADRALHAVRCSSGQSRAHYRAAPRNSSCRVARAEDLQGGDAAYNAHHLRAVLEGRERGAHRNAIVLQAALVLELMGKATSPANAAAHGRRRHRSRRRRGAAAKARRLRQLTADSGQRTVTECQEDACCSLIIAPPHSLTRARSSHHRYPPSAVRCHYERPTHRNGADESCKTRAGACARIRTGVVGACVGCAAGAALEAVPGRVRRDRRMQAAFAVGGRSLGAYEQRREPRHCICAGRRLRRVGAHRAVAFRRHARTSGAGRRRAHAAQSAGRCARIFWSIPIR